jgi:hypothetical protein
MAYSTPVDIKELRDQAALISMAWKEHEEIVLAKRANGTNEANPTGSSARQGLETLTIEFQHNNIIVRAIQPKLLLVLVGGVPPSRKALFKVTPEAHGDPRYPPIEVLESEEGSTSQPESALQKERSPTSSEDGQTGKAKAASIMSNMSQREKDLKIGALHIQRKKLDALTEFIRADFDAKGFVMPDDSVFP